ncbi:MAG TPA: TetR/AcrR family transcriptional regulator [Micrococcaceae bacterium]
MARPKIHDDGLRQRLLASAAELVHAKGVDGLSMRQLAAVVGTSTTAIYSLFGGKSELLEAVVMRGFTSFTSAQAEAVGGRDAIVDLRNLGTAYRRWALANPTLYTLMFSGALNDFVRSEEALSSSTDGLRPLIAAVRLGQATRVLRAADPESVAMHLWATVHGLASLELAGLKNDQQDWTVVFESSLEASLRAWSAERENGSWETP